MTKYGLPVIVLPASMILAMFGCSMIASACFSRANLETTCFVSMPSLMILSATIRLTGSFCSAFQTSPKPPDPMFCMSV